MNRGRRRVALLVVFAFALLGGAPSTFARTGPAGEYQGNAATLDAPGTVRLMAVGDVMLAQSIGRRIKNNGLLAPWAKVKGHFDDADLVVANLECTISDRGTAVDQDVHVSRAHFRRELTGRRRHRCRVERQQPCPGLRPRRVRRHAHLPRCRRRWPLRRRREPGRCARAADHRAQRPAHRVPGLRAAVLGQAQRSTPGSGQQRTRRPVSRSVRRMSSRPT